MKSRARKGSMKGLVDSDIAAKAQALGIDLSFGHVDGDGRFVVYKASAFPGARSREMALRTRLVWWLATGDVVTGITHGIHHRNRNRLDDRLQNLEKMLQVDHGHLHNPQVLVKVICRTCQKEFERAPYRVTGKTSQFCSRECSRKRRLTESEHKKLLARMDKAHDWRRSMTTCKHGHPFDEKNTRIEGGRRRCRICISNRAKAYQKRQREELACRAS